MTDTIVAPAANVASGLRARREAACRLPPLDEGRRDPLDPRTPRPRPTHSTGKQVISVRVRDGRALVKGWLARELLDAVSAPRRWSPSGRGYVTPARYVPDVMACAETRCVIVAYVEDADK